MAKPTTVEEYISDCPAEAQKLLKQLRALIMKEVPDGVEVISYSMPAVKLHGMLCWYAAHTNHIGFYPRASAIEAFEKELTSYKTSKGAIQFPFDKPLPARLIGRIVKFRVKENLQKAELKKKTAKRK